MAADETPFKQYCPQGMDYMICYDLPHARFRYLHPGAIPASERSGMVHGRMGSSHRTGFRAQGETAAYSFQWYHYPYRWHRWNSRKDLPKTPWADWLPPRSRSSCAACAKTAMPTKPSLPSLPAGTSTKLRKSWNSLRKNTPNERDNHRWKRQLYLLQWWRDGCYVNDKYQYIDYDYAFIGVNDRIFPLENMKLNFDYMFDDDKLIVADCAHYDEPMFRFLLQDMWSMPIDDFLSHLRELDT